MEITVWVTLLRDTRGDVTVKLFNTEDDAKVWRQCNLEEADCVITLPMKHQVSDDEVYQYALDTFENLVDSDNPPEYDEP
jgi:hypothetical protein